MKCANPCIALRRCSTKLCPPPPSNCPAAFISTACLSPQCCPGVFEPFVRSSNEFCRMSSSSYIQPKAVHASDQFKGNLQSLLHGGKSPAPFIMPDFRNQSSSMQPASHTAFQNIVSQSPMPRVRLRSCVTFFLHDLLTRPSRSMTRLAPSVLLYAVPSSP